MAFVHNFAEIIACGCSSVRLRVHVPFAVAVSAANIRLYCAVLPRSAIVENGCLETGFEQFIRRGGICLSVPLAPVREAACGKFVGFNHLLCRSTVSATFLKIDGVVASRCIVVVKAVGDVIGTAEEILENDLLVACRRIRVGVIRSEVISESGDFFGGIYYCLIVRLRILGRSLHSVGGIKH